MPPSTSKSQLAEEFAEFFHTKIEKKIRKSLKILIHINLDNLDVPLLRKIYTSYN